MNELDRLIGELAEAQAAYDAAREERFIQGVWRDSRTQVALAQQHAKVAQMELQRCKDNVCNFLLANREKVKLEA